MYRSIRGYIARQYNIENRDEIMKETRANSRAKWQGINGLDVFFQKCVLTSSVRFIDEDCTAG